MRTRQSNIELLRIVVILGVIVLHYNNPSIGGGLTYVKAGSLNFYILYFLESLFVCGVDLFILISGYFMCTSYKRNLWRLVELFVQVMVFKEATYFARVLFVSESFSIKTMLTTLIPANYFLILYSVVFILSPYINSMLDGLAERSSRALIILSIITFSLYPTFVDFLGEYRGEPLNGLSTIGMYGSQWGYSAINFLLMYLIGAYLRKGQSKIHKTKTWILLLLLLIVVSLVLIWARVNDKVGFITERSAWEYSNPLIILTAVLLFELFSRIKLGTKQVINVLSDSVFTVFLLHSVFIPYLQIEKFVNENPGIMIIHIILCSTTIFMICWCVHMLYHLLIDPVFRFLSTRYNSFCIEVKPREIHFE